MLLHNPEILKVHRRLSRKNNTHDLVITGLFADDDVGLNVLGKDKERRQNSSRLQHAFFA